MKRAVIIAPKTIELQETNIPEIQPDEVLVRVKAVGLCTFEQRYYEGVQKAYPFVGGHEICGVVEQVGSKVAQDLNIGDQVVVASLTRCGECYYCRRGLDHLCSNADEKTKPGEMWGPGGLSEFMVAKSYEVYKVSNELNPAEATVAEPLACVIRSIEKGNIHFGDTIVVIGAGIMGLLHVKLAKLKGARVIVSEPDETRRQKALETGADAVVDPLNENLKEVVKSLTEGRGAHAVFYTAGGTPAIEQGISLLIKSGTIVIYGSIHPAQPISIDPNDVHYDEIIVTGVVRHTKDSFRKSALLLSQGLVQVRDLISECIPLEDINHAFERAISKDTYRVAVMF
jgi:2-desacetyl-2-hydroxyethyl bacteriochlorophyllide A dehydrogenase